MSGFACFAPPAIPRRATAGDRLVVFAGAGGGGGGSGRSERRLMTSLHAAPDAAAAGRLIRRFVAAASKPVALAAFAHLVSASSPFALPFYEEISETQWFKWTPRHAAAVAALLEANGRAAESESLISDSTSRLRSVSDVALFYCDLTAAFSSRGLRDKAMKFYAQLKSRPLAGRKAYEAMIKSLCSMGLAAEAEEMLAKMASLRLLPSPFEFRSVAQCHGKAGSFSDMERVVAAMSEAGHALDAVAANVVLSCYGDHGEHAKMASWVRDMRASGVKPTVRTYNAVLNSCPTLVGMVQELRSRARLPASTQELVKKLEADSPWPAEAELVQELAVFSASALGEVAHWSAAEAKLDLHGFHAAAAFVATLQWVEEAERRLLGTNAGAEALPGEVSVVCGVGRHSEVRGEGKVRKAVGELLFRMGSPLRLDRRNEGRFVAKGTVVKEWLASIVEAKNAMASIVEAKK